MYIIAIPMLFTVGNPMMGGASGGVAWNGIGWLQHDMKSAALHLCRRRTDTPELQCVGLGSTTLEETLDSSVWFPLIKRRNNSKPSSVHVTHCAVKSCYGLKRLRSPKGKINTCNYDNLKSETCANMKRKKQRSFNPKVINL